MTDRLAPIRAAVLIGGASTRMGRPKHLLEIGGQTLVERTLTCIRQVSPEVTIVGTGVLPAALTSVPRLLDPPGLHGPGAALVALVSHDVEAAWLVCACDQPRLTADALRWLLEQRDERFVAVLPRSADGRVQPLPGLYEPAARAAIEVLARRGSGPRALASLARVKTPQIPAALAAEWSSANTPGDWDRLTSAKPA